ncbi:MAG TPA: alpha/beta hydrolase family protein [Terriglobia bacterium]|nr:alpha/beta hydrolase family protein [Terriglobia bacterium]
MRPIRQAFPVFALLLLVSGVLAVAAAQRGGGFRDVIPTGSRVEYKTLHSKLLNQDLAYGLYLPPSYAKSDKKYPVLYFLHGLNENEKRWSTRGETDLLLDRMVAEGKIGEFIVAIPNAANSFYTNARGGRQEPWEDYIVQEFIPAIESANRVIGTRATRGISGISMGGYGSLKIAMKHPEMFGSVSAHSAALIVDLDHAVAPARQLERFRPLFDQIFAINTDLTYWNANNPLEFAKDTTKLKNLKIYADCGTEDDYGFFDGLKAFDQTLTKASYPHEAHLYAGNHGWDFAKQHTTESLLFHWKAFDSK